VISNYIEYNLYKSHIIQEARRVIIAKKYNFLSRIFCSISLNWVTICRQTWRDEYLTWKPEDHGNIGMILIPSDKLWTPNFIVFNSWVCLRIVHGHRWDNLFTIS